MNITKKLFGRTEDGIDIDIYTLRNSNGLRAEIINFGGAVVSLSVPDRDGNIEDVVLGYDRLEAYESNRPYFGAIIGRHANRIEAGCFELNGKEYRLAVNNGPNHLHGGIRGFDKVVWQAEAIEDRNALELTYTSKDEEEGYPGNLTVKVTYTLTEDNELKIEYFAVSDADTVINLTNHSYFNLSAHSSGNILNHKVWINADYFTVNDEFSAPTGEIRAVVGTPMDFTKPIQVSKGINEAYEQILFGNGYDHNWILNTKGDINKKAAQVIDENSGRIMEVYTTKPGVQLYTGYYLGNPAFGTGKGGAIYEKRNGLCLETQFFPNAMKHKHFPSPVLRTGEEYRHCTTYKFSIKQ